ncbi:hypothetical protein [Corynebacterium pyruviciproducens]|uniref:Phage tail protein n=1 Tax=Corynebacterium pyruviciproducens TaxID=598660 RepID=A0AAF0YSI0_9CORY|nr:hypothetical protein [Corynebacterium pyruviciproducens]WOT03372.1 phage tail protein [Corynebacterium pyruviciproducens]
MINDNAVFTASTGFVYVGPVGTAAPTREQVAKFDPETFGSHQFTLKVAGSASYKLTVGSEESGELKPDATAGEVQEALEKLSAVGQGGAVVEGSDPKVGYTVSFIGKNFGKKVVFKGDTGATVTQVAEPRGWEPIGHTSNDDLPEFGYDGGDSETKGSWQKKNLREVSKDAPVDYVTIKPIQFDAETLELYYGKNASKEEGVFGVDAPGGKSVERAVLIVIRDGDFTIAFTAAKAGVRREESISMASDDFATLPIRATFLKHPGRHLYQWILPAK